MSMIGNTVPIIGYGPDAKDYSLRLYAPVLVNDGAFEEDLTNRAVDYKRSRAFEGGYWLGSFKVYGEIEELEKWFYERLGYHFVERVGDAVTWEGMVYEVDLVYSDQHYFRPRSKRGRRMRRSLEWLVNRVKAAYVDPSDNTTGESSWYTNAESIARYGQKDEILRLEVDVDLVAETVQRYLELHATAPPQIMTLENVDAPYVEVTVAGYIMTAQWRYVTVANDTTTSIYDYFNAIVNTDCEFLTPGIVDTNTLTITRTLEEEMRAFDLMVKLTEMGDHNNAQRRIHVTKGRRLNYQAINPSPIGYYINGRFVSTTFAELEDQPRMVLPGVYRDQNRRIVVPIVQSSFFSDPRDFLVVEFEVDENNALIPRLGRYSEEEAWRTSMPSVTSASGDSVVPHGYTQKTDDSWYGGEGGFG